MGKTKRVLENIMVLDVRVKKLQYIPPLLDEYRKKMSCPDKLSLSPETTKLWAK
jgi:hypothetical protein